MKYKGDYYNMWDAWFMNVSGTVHAFHLKDHPGKWNVGHITTDDLLHFKQCADILHPLDEEKYPDDCVGKFTGCAYYDEKTQKAYVYYTMRNKSYSEKIGVAISDDLVNFPVYENNPVLEADENLFIKNSKPNGSTDCRDMLVVFDEKTLKYYGYFAAMANINNRKVGVIAVAVSDDLLNWRDQTVVYVPKFTGVLEVPDVFFLDGKWYLTYLTGSRYGAKGAVKDPNLVKFNLYASADTPLGPFVDSEDNIFLCGGEKSGYSCRSVMFKGKRYVFYVDQSEYGAAISLPKEIRVADGKLRPCYTEILQKLRTGKEYTDAKACDFQKQINTFAWEIYGSDIIDTENGLFVSTDKFTYQRYLCNMFSAPSVEAELKLKAECTECGVFLYTFDENGQPKETYTVSLNFEFGELIVYREEKSSNDFIPFFKRLYSFDKNKDYHLRVIAGEGQLEIYIDDVLELQGNMFTESCMQAGLFCASGKASFSQIHFYELEK